MPRLAGVLRLLLNRPVGDGTYPGCGWAVKHEHTWVAFGCKPPTLTIAWTQVSEHVNNRFSGGFFLKLLEQLRTQAWDY